MELKLDDIYKFHYNSEWYKKIFDPNWCFDGQLIVREYREGGLFLEDTYWGSSCENKSFTLEQALERGELTFICNLNDVEPIESHKLCYYADEDLFDLSSQHGCYKKIYKRKGAKRSASKMEQVLKDKIERIKQEIKSKEYELEWTTGKLKELQNGNIDIYI